MWQPRNRYGRDRNEIWGAGSAIEKGGLQPPFPHAQTLEQQVTVAGRHRYRASGRVRPCWDPACPCCSLLTGCYLGAGGGIAPIGAGGGIELPD
jgi:hypothetical protein